VPAHLAKLQDYKQLMSRFYDSRHIEREAGQESDFEKHTSLTALNTSSSAAGTAPSALSQEDSIVSGGSESGDELGMVLNVSNEKSHSKSRYEAENDATTMILFVFGFFSFVAIVGYRRTL
jgi:hypothetical protein